MPAGDGEAVHGRPDPRVSLRGVKHGTEAPMASTVWLSLILPAYNEVGRIRETIAEAKAYLDRRGYPCEIIVAADGGDGTREAGAELARSDQSEEHTSELQSLGLIPYA